MRAALLTMVSILALACTRHPRPNDSPPKTHSPTPPVPVPAPTPTPPPPPPDAANLAPPPVDPTCSTDTDCEVLSIEVSGPGACCSSCATTPGNHAWAARLHAFCAGKPPDVCPPLGCPMGSMKSRCDSGRCVLTF
jgi:hypothetical protein